MNWKTTIVLLAIAIAGGAYIKLYEMKRPDTAEAKRRAQNVVNFNREKINGIVIWNGDDKINMRRDNNKWRLDAPIKDQADNALIDNLLSELETWQKDATISAKEIKADKSKLDEFGLNKPKLRLRLRGEDEPRPILFGKDAALEGKMYVRLENSKETFLASQSIKKAIEKKADEFRDRKLTDLVTAQVSRLIIKTSAGEMELEKKGEHWEIAKPMRARGDDQGVRRVEPTRNPDHDFRKVQRAQPLLKVGRAQVPLPPGAFLQATAAGEAVLARLVIAHVGAAKNVADLFSGIGTFALHLAESARVTAADNEASAVKALERAAQTTSSLKPVEAQTRDLFRRPFMTAELKAFDAVVFDPPRQGAEAQARELAKSKVATVVAVSCDTATFARDAALLIEGGYKLCVVTPVDQFRYSFHVELLAKFEK